MNKTIALTIAVGLMLFAVAALGGNGVTQVHQNFSKDPGWEGVNNRVVAENPPTKTENFGYSATTHSTRTPGEIGGTMWCSRTPAWYAMPIGKPLSYKDSFSVSGRIALVSAKGSGYIGFFNSQQQGWRPWSAIGIRLSNAKRGTALSGKQIEGAQIWIDYMTATWKAGYMVLDSFIPADGSVHTFRLAYDANARVDTHWPDANLEALFGKHSRMSEDDILAQLQKQEPSLNTKALRAMLRKARGQGLLDYDPRRGHNYWEAKRDLDKVRGRITFQLDDQPAQYSFLDPGIHDEPTVMDRFGLYNFQIPGGKTIEFYVSDLVVNGHKIDLSKDPRWQGKGNHVTFVERDFHPGQDYGYSQTNWAGKQIGEIGGLFWRNEPIDPYHGYYADDIGSLTLDDPISFSGDICFVNGGTDASMMFGYFNRADQMRKLSESDNDYRPQVLGLQIDDQTSNGYFFTALLCNQERNDRERGPQFVPDRVRRHFSFNYDPSANDGIGRITAKLDDHVITLNLKPAQRRAGAHFDRFGLINVRSGGKYVEVYFDDLTYTVKRPADFKPVFHVDRPVKIQYPPWGRLY